MAMLKPSPTINRVGVYQWLADREEQEYRDWQTSHGRTPGQVYLGRRSLNAVRAGRPMRVTVGQLPEWARPSGTPPPPRSSTEAMARRRRRGRRAMLTVYADDRVVPHEVGDDSEPIVTIVEDYRDL
jgi:hypothetical protein